MSNYSDGNILYAGSLNKHFGNIQDSGIHIGSYMSAIPPGGIISVGSTLIRTVTGSGLFLGILHVWRSYNDPYNNIQVPIKIEVDGTVFWSGTIPTYSTDAATSMNMGHQNFNQKFWSILSAYYWTATAGSVSTTTIQIDYQMD